MTVGEKMNSKGENIINGVCISYEMYENITDTQ